MFSVSQTIFKNLISAALISLCLMPCAGAENAAADIEALRKNMSAIDRDLQKETAKAKRYSADEIKLIDKLNRIDRALNKTHRQAARLTSEMAAIDNELSRTRASIEDLKQDIRKNENDIGRRLTALYKLNLMGRIHLLASAESLYDMLNRKTSIEHILGADANLLETQRANHVRLTELEKQLSLQKKTKQTLGDDYKKKAALMLAEKNNRSAILEDVRTKKALQATLIQQLQEASENLSRTIKALVRKSNRHPENHDTQAHSSFFSYKGLLKMPVKGNIAVYFGPDKDEHTQTATFNNGIEIEAARGEPIQAVYSGTILFSNWLKGYGNLIIIHHDDSYYTLYAHAEELFKAQGDTVETGEVIATVGDTGSMTGAKLHFEVRHHNTPLNPLEWLAQG